MRRVAVLGGGGMGTAMAVLLARCGDNVRLWVREPELAQEMIQTRENSKFLKGVKIPEKVCPMSDAALVLRGAELILAAIPTAFLRATLWQLSSVTPGGVPVMSVIKGIEQGSFARPSQVIMETLGDRPVAILSGPSHAEEIGLGLPASVVLSCEDGMLAALIRDSMRSATFRVYLNADPIGVELAGSLKNILGLAAGICEGLGYGDNAKAALLTRGLVEMARFSVTLGAKQDTFWGLAGIGDVLATCYSRFGRNRAVGLSLGHGKSLVEAQEALGGGVAEGVYTTRSVNELATRRGVEMPITAEVHAILFEGKPPKKAVADLMLRDPKFE